MQELMQTIPIAHSSIHVRLAVESFDSGEECSFQHWMEVCKLVDEGDVPTEEEIADLEPAAWN